MKKESFQKLVDLLRHDVTVDEKMASLRGGAILPEICLHCTLRCLAGASCLDVHFHTGISKTAFYHVTEKTMDAINKNSQLAPAGLPTTPEACAQLAEGFASVSHGRAISNCVGALDGHLLKTTTPSKKETSSVRSFFSGHCQCHGVNVQGVADSCCRFLHLCVTGPGVMHDRQAFHVSISGESIKSLTEKFPTGHVIIADCACEPSENVAPIHSGNDAKEKRHDDFNFCASQCRICVEMAFGLMQQKWGILKRPLQVRLKKLKHIVGAICRLHNFVINERTEESLKEAQELIEQAAENALPLHSSSGLCNNLTGAPLPDPEDPNNVLECTVSLPGQSSTRESMVLRVESLELERPLANKIGN